MISEWLRAARRSSIRSPSKRSSSEPDELKERLQEGQALVESGDLDDAEQHYLLLTAEYPGSSSAFLHLGNLYILQRRWTDAIRPLRAGARIDPASTKLRTSLGRALLKNGDVAEAIALLQGHGGDNLDAQSLLLLQQAHARLCDWPAVAETGARLLNILPQKHPALGTVLGFQENALVEIEAGKFEKAAQAGEFEIAHSGLSAVTTRFPNSPLAWLKFGTFLAEAGRNAEAASAARNALLIPTENPKLRARLTQLFVRTAEDEEVLNFVQNAIASGTADAQCYHWLAQHHYAKHDWAAALESAEEALAIDPQHKAAQFQATKALVRLHRLPEALDQLDLLLSADPKRTAALQLKGDIFVQLTRIDEAIQLYRKALKLLPDDPMLNHRLGNALLLKGDIAGFHRLHEHRRGLRTFVQNNKDYPFPDWNGELHPEGKLLVWSEFGLGVGQNILHMTFLKPLAALGLEVVFQVEPRLLELCRRSFPNISVIDHDAELPVGISHQTPIASLGRWFKPDLASFHSMEPFLLPDAQAVKALRAKLQAAAGERPLLVGISWTSNNPYVGDLKSVELDELLIAAGLPGVTLVNLQYGDHGEAVREAVATTGKPLMDSGVDTTNDLDGLAALVAALDLVVCIGHTTAHVAGAIGTPNFVLLPAGPFAHWLARGSKCIWYPTSTLFRQAPVDDGWGSVLNEVGNAISDFQKLHRPDSWLETTLLGGSSAEAAGLSAQQLRDCVECFSKQGAYRSALELSGRVPPHDTTRELSLKRGEMLTIMGNWDEAKATYAALRPEDQLDLEVERRLLSVHLSKYDLDAALPVARSLAKEDPTFGLVVGNVLRVQRRYDEALGELRALSLNLPEADGLSTTTGTLLLEMGEFERAAVYLSTEVTVKRLPQDYTLLGRAMSAQGRHDDALEAYDRALSLLQGHPSASFWRTQERIKGGSATLCALPAVAGAAPNAATSDVVLFFAADSAYFWRHGLVLIDSLGRNSPKTKCHVHLVNPDPWTATAIEIIRELLPNLDLSYSYETIDLDGLSSNQIRTYYASVRFVRLAEMFERVPATYLCVDTDCIVRDDISASAAKLAAGDVAIRMRYDHRPNLAVAAGGLVLRPSVAAREFIGEVASLIRTTLEAREAVWFLDQVVLSHVVRARGGGQVEINQLDMDYIDWFFRDESVIWTGKGKRKFEDARYTREVAAYRHLQGEPRIAELMRRASEASADAVNVVGLSLERQEGN